MSRKSCLWCADPNSDVDSPDPYSLCRSHYAEYLGTSEADLDRGERELDAEYADAMGW